MDIHKGGFLLKSELRIQLRDLLAAGLKREYLRPYAPEHEVLRLQLPLAQSSTSLLRWLGAQEPGPRAYWMSRDRSEGYAAVGALHQYSAHTEQTAQSLVNRLENLLSSYPKPSSAPRYFGGQGFSDNVAQSDPALPYACWILPRFELSLRDEKMAFAINLDLTALRDPLKREDELNDFWADFEALNFPLSSPEQSLPRVTTRNAHPSKAHWMNAVTSALHNIRGGKLEKAVLSRTLSLEFDAELDPQTLLEYLACSGDESYQLLFSLDAHSTLLACSPERLFLRRNRQFLSEALAGTELRGRSVSEDEALSRALLGDAKNNHEHRLVADYLEQSLRPLVRSEPLTDNLYIKRLSRVQHLCCNISAELRDEVGSGDLLAAIHPTPALCGYPKSAAMRCIDDFESYARGWYGGCFGMISATHTEMAVIIRCARYADQRLTLYSGAGIVKGSDAALEWRETEAKLAHILAILESGDSVNEVEVFEY